MADILYEVKRAIDRQIQRSVNRDAAYRTGDIRAQVNTQAGVVQLSGASEDLQDYSTGYDGANTTLPFSWDVSYWGNPDIWTG